jgi:hypothetical protein
MAALSTRMCLLLPLYSSLSTPPSLLLPPPFLTHHFKCDNKGSAGMRSISAPLTLPRGLWTDFGNLAQNQGWPLCCTAKCGLFSSNPRRIHSGKKDKEKEEYGLLWAVIYPMPPLLSPLQLPPFPHRASVAPPAATLSGLAEGRLLPRPLPHPRTPHCWIWTVFSDLGQSEDSLRLGV